MNPTTFIDSWLTPESGLKNAEEIIKRLMKLPIGDFYRSEKLREEWRIANYLRSWFTHKATIQRQVESE